MATSDGISTGDNLLLDAGTHAHFNYGFSARGSYDVTFEAVATLPDGSRTSSGYVTYRFVVNTASVAVDDSFTATEDTPLIVGPGSGLLANDTMLMQIHCGRQWFRDGKRTSHSQSRRFVHICAQPELLRH